MNLIEAVNNMDMLQNPSLETLKDTLFEGLHVIVGDRNNYGNLMIKYDFFIEDDILVAGKLSDSTRDEIIITLETIEYFDDELFEGLWTNYLEGRDAFFVDSECIMQSATINSGQFDYDAIKKGLKRGEVFLFNDVYSPVEGLDPIETNIYIINNDEAPFVGIDAVKNAVLSCTGAKEISDMAKADFIILILPNQTKAPHNDFYQWLNSESQSIQIVKATLKKYNITLPSVKPILLYWSSNVFMSGLFDPEKTAFKATSELSNAINEYHKK